MLLLLFEIGEGRYAMGIDEIVEIVPFVKLKKIPMAQNYVAGLMNYRGNPIPVVDLNKLIEGTPSEPRLSTRIIIIRYFWNDEEGESLLGLIAHQITETIKTELKSIPTSGVLMDEALYRDRIESDDEGMVQWFDVKRMLPAGEISMLFQ